MTAHYTIPGYVVGPERVERVYYTLADKFISDNDNFYVPRLIKYMITPEEAELCCQFPATEEELVAALGWAPETVHSLLRDCIKVGLAHLNRKNGKIAFAQSIVNIADFGAIDPELIRTRFGTEFLDLLKGIRTSPEYFEDYAAFLESKKTVDENGVVHKRTPLFRILPRYDAIKNIPGVMPCENLMDILDEQEYISTARCMCRTVGRHGDLAYEGSGAPEEGHCVKFGDAARYFVEEMGLGRYLTKNELLANLNAVKDTPLYHMIGNSRIVKGGFCNCCDDCCDMKMLAKHLPDFRDGLLPSRFAANADTDACIGCGHCASLCQFGAIGLGSGTASVDPEACMGCGVCVVNCPSEALSLSIVRPPSFIPEDGPQHIQDSLDFLE